MSKTKSRTAAGTTDHPVNEAEGLRSAIEKLITAKRGGDYRGSAKVTAELVKIGRSASGSSLVQQAANEALAVAGNSVLVDSLRHLRAIVARLPAGS